MPQQQSEERDDLFLGNVGQIEESVEVAPLPAGTDGHRRDRRHFVMRIGPMAQERCAPARRPGPLDRWDQEESTLVEKREVGVQALRFFLMATQ